MDTWFRYAVADPSADTGSVVHARLKNLVGELDLDHFAFVMALPPPSHDGGIGIPTAINNYPPVWVALYLLNRYDLVDPILDAAARTARPFFWGGGGFLRGLGKSQRKMMEHAGRFGLCHGLSIPVHCPGCPSGMLAVVAKEEGRLRQAVRGAHELLYGAAYDTHKFLSSQVAAGPDACVRPALTTREKECLLWTAEGKTAEEVAEILGLSAFTVNRHVSTATRKLGCTNKHHAACRALIGGLIRPRPVSVPPVGSRGQPLYRRA